MTERLYLRLDGDPALPPEATVPPGTMTDLPIAPALRGHVAHMSAYQESIPDGVALHERVLPDGAMRLIINLGDTPATAGGGPAMFVAGASVAPVLLELRGHLAGMSLTLRPGATEALFGTPARQLGRGAVALDDLRPDAGLLREQLLRAWPDHKRCGAIVNAALERRLDDRDPALRRRASRAVQLFVAGAGRPSVSAVASRLGIGERRLQQVFRDHVGLPPRAVRRLARLHGCLRSLRAARGLPHELRWGSFALQAGYCDQAHLVRDFQALCGMTPGAYLERAISGSSKTSDLDPDMLAP